MSGALGADWNTWLMSRLLEAVWPGTLTCSMPLPVWLPMVAHPGRKTAAA